MMTKTMVCSHGNNNHSLPKVLISSTHHFLVIQYFHLRRQCVSEIKNCLPCVFTLSLSCAVRIGVISLSMFVCVYTFVSMYLSMCICVCVRTSHVHAYSLVQCNWFSDATDACNSGASGDHREPISLHQAVCLCICAPVYQCVCASTCVFVCPHSPLTGVGFVGGRHSSELSQPGLDLDSRGKELKKKDEF